MDVADGRLRVGRVISNTFGAIGRNIGAVGVLAVLVMALSTGLNFWAGFGLDAFSRRAALLAGPFVRSMVAVVAGTIATGGITHAVVSDLHGRKAGIGTALTTGLRLALPLLGLTIVSSLGIGLASLLLLVPGMMLAMRWFVAAPARVVEGNSLAKSLSRSAELTAGNRWRVLVVFVAVLALALCLGALIGLVGGLIGLRLAPATRVIVIGTVQAVAGTVARCLMAAAAAACYAELRRLREGATSGQVAAVFA